MSSGTNILYPGLTARTTPFWNRLGQDDAPRLQQLLLSRWSFVSLSASQELASFPAQITSFDTTTALQKAFRYLLSWWYIENTWLLSRNLPWINSDLNCILQTASLKISDMTNMRSHDTNEIEPLVSGFSLTSLMSLMITLSVDNFCHFQPCNPL